MYFGLEREPELFAVLRNRIQLPCSSWSSAAHTTSLFQSASIAVTKSHNMKDLKCLLVNLTSHLILTGRTEAHLKMADF